MTRSQILIIAVLAGFVALVFVGLVILLLANPIQPASPPPTLVPPSATLMPTPTLPNFMPTAGPSATPLPPTPINTLVPTITPRPTHTPLPTVEFNLPTRVPTDTPTSLPPTAAPPTSTPVEPTATLATLFYKFNFKATDSAMVKGECTHLEWEVIGAVAVTLDGSSVEPTGKKEVCPKKDTRYKMSVEFPDFSAPQEKTVEISVKEP